MGGPIAILAMLFPTLFGGVLLLFRRWLAFFSVVATISTIYMVHRWFAGALLGSWWGTQTALWLALTLVTLLGTFWASRRHPIGPPADAPPRAEAVVLGLLALGCLGGVICYWIDPPVRLDTTWKLLLILAVGVWSAALYKLIQRLAAGRGSTSRRAIPTEAVILWTALIAFTGFAAARPSPPPVQAEPIAADEGRPVAQLKEDGWWHKQFGSGLIVSSPLVTDDRIYVAVAHRRGLQNFGTLYCLDLKTQDVLWSFDNDGDMKQVYSSPRLADGRVYIGEGFHDDVNCRLYCLDARTGKLCWPPFPTTSQTESSPCIGNGKVVFGAGNDGVYALDTATGKKLWQFPEKPDPSRLLRVCANPIVAGGRVYVGSGVDRFRPDDPGETAVFCLDAETGRLLWKIPTELPCWAAATLAGEHVFFALGNGDLFSDAPEPAGAVLCVEARTGRLVWRHDVPNGVIEKPAVDAHRVYFGSRDGHCYCLSRWDGRELWKKSLGSPVVAAVALDSCPDRGLTASVFAISTQGRVCCLDATTGKVHWTCSEIEPYAAHVSSSPTVKVSHVPGGDRRRLFFGAALNTLNIPALYCLEDLLPER